MSTYYYLACDDCRVMVPIARRGAGAGSIIGDEDVPAFAVAHHRHKVQIIDEHADECMEYSDFEPEKPARQGAGTPAPSGHE